MIVCSFLSFFAAYKTAAESTNKRRYFYSTLYLGFVLLWHSLQLMIMLGLQSILIRIDTVPLWKKMLSLLAWVSVFAALLFIQVLIRTRLKKWIKINSLIYIPVFFIMILGFIALMKQYMFCLYFF